MKLRICSYLLILLAGIPLISCIPYEEEEVLADISINLEDPAIQRIYTFQNQQLRDSLIRFFDHEKPTYRYLAAVAFASFLDTAATDALAVLLRDPVDEVRAAAAYALGQLGETRSEPLLINAFERHDTIGRFEKANRAILEAIGKVGSEAALRNLSTVSTYEVTDTALLEGQAWGIYRYALRDIVAPEGTERMLELSTNSAYPASVRLIAAQYLYRARGLQLDSLDGIRLARVLPTEAEPRIRMALVIGLGKTGSAPALDALINQYNLDEDYRVKTNILSAFGNFPYPQVQAVALEGLRDPNPHVSARAAQYFLQHGVSEDATLYWRLTRDTLPWQSTTKLFAAALRHLPTYYDDYRSAINAQLRRYYLDTGSPYARIAAMNALTEWPWNLRFIQREGYQATPPIVRAAAVQALGTIARNANGVPAIGGPTFTKELSIYFQQAIESGEPGMMSAAAEALLDPSRDYARAYDSLAFLANSLNRLDSTQYLFTHDALKKAYDHLRGNKNQALQPSPKAIDWSTLPTSSIEPVAIVETNRGVIQLRLLPAIAPASVANFIELARTGYFRGKYFYRVVPNFVVQGVAAQQAEEESFTIRSELPPVHYTEGGLLGMASSGLHTESTQFFITHSPTPHLDGKYTLFGRVMAGMDVVHQLQEGDFIESVVIR